MHDLIPLLAIFIVLGLPMIGLVTRFAIRPLVQDVTRALREPSAEATGEGSTAAARLDRLEERLEAQELQIERLVEAERFRRRLEAGRLATGDAAGSPSASRVATGGGPDAASGANA